MKRMTRFAVVFLLGYFGHAVYAEVSAVRLPGESFEAARDRHLPFPWASTPLPSTALPSAYESAVPFNDLDLKSLPTQKKEAELFQSIRDARHLFSSLRPGFARRSSWLYPQDGCWVRASVSRRLADAHGFGDLKKIFIFGSLSVVTKNAPGGRVRWWYHVVPIYEDGFGVAKVIDPAIEPSRPLALADWIQTMVASADYATYSICSPSTYDPTSPCVQLDTDADREASMDQADYLNYEWDNLVRLGRDPATELADFPPWMLP